MYLRHKNKENLDKGLFTYYVIRFWGHWHPLVVMSSCSHLLGYPLVVQNGWRNVWIARTKIIFESSWFPSVLITVTYNIGHCLFYLWSSISIDSTPIFRCTWQLVWMVAFGQLQHNMRAREPAFEADVSMSPTWTSGLEVPWPWYQDSRLQQSDMFKWVYVSKGCSQISCQFQMLITQ